MHDKQSLLDKEPTEENELLDKGLDLEDDEVIITYALDVVRNHAFINQYNYPIMELLLSNMDVTFVYKVYHCNNYIAKYITKPEVKSNSF